MVTVYRNFQTDASGSPRPSETKFETWTIKRTNLGFGEQALVLLYTTNEIEAGPNTRVP